MTIQIEERCGLCGAGEVEDLPEATRLWRIRQGQRMVRCARCGLVQVLPRTTGTVDYDQDYFTRHPVCEEGAVEYSARIRLFRQRLGEIGGYVSPGRLLDVGCAKGDFLRVARDEFSWDVVGLDVSEWAAKYARSVYGIEVQVTLVTEACFSIGEFDVIHSNHVWEHLPAPLTALQKANEWLKPGGYFYLEVPNEIDSLPWHLDKFLGRTRIEGSVFGRREPRTNPTPHLSFFTLKTLTRMIERSGLQVVASRTRTDITQPGTWFRKNFSMATKLKVMFYHLTRLTGQFIGRGSNIIVIAHKPISTSSARQ